MDLTLLIQKSGADNKDATDKLFDLVYNDLKNLARKVRFSWRNENTINTTALVHEAYLKVLNSNEIEHKNKLHFYRICGRAMRYILQDYSKKKNAGKRGGQASKVDVEIHNQMQISDEAIENLEEIFISLRQLEQNNKATYDVVECRFFSNMTVNETAELLSISPATVKRKWSFAKAFITQSLKNQN
ncbi:ECF-type sigma factor [Mangrovivirga cuniculi]|uniref:RNA polymerase sigma-70 ECF-like HTH domain-containing protein n=1 Tax=Mangrovivirga cuniculi TaxID=2715131 RepID=A0A4D7JJ59_9BACT|nr:ECF-type sigma factor [Mangrovivirga cuniculi]QCK15621.1 hypothetical protein DCC35_13135 [Mangrovivirga cuniculi]